MRPAPHASKVRPYMRCAKSDMSEVSTQFEPNCGEQSDDEARPRGFRSTIPNVLLISYCLPPTLRSQEGMAHHDRCRIFFLVRDLGAGRHAVNFRGNTALHFTCNHGHTDVAVMLVRDGGLQLSRPATMKGAPHRV